MKSAYTSVRISRGLRDGYQTPLFSIVLLRVSMQKPPTTGIKTPLLEERGSRATRPCPEKITKPSPPTFDRIGSRKDKRRNNSSNNHNRNRIKDNDENPSRPRLMSHCLSRSVHTPRIPPAVPNPLQEDSRAFPLARNSSSPCPRPPRPPRPRQSQQVNHVPIPAVVLHLPRIINIPPTAPIIPPNTVRR
jgi:hypothetical protein